MRAGGCVPQHPRHRGRRIRSSRERAGRGRRRHGRPAAPSRASVSDGRPGASPTSTSSASGHRATCGRHVPIAASSTTRAPARSPAPRAAAGPLGGRATRGSSPSRRTVRTVGADDGSRWRLPAPTHALDRTRGIRSSRLTHASGAAPRCTCSPPSGPADRARRAHGRVATHRGRRGRRSIADACQTRRTTTGAARARHSSDADRLPRTGAAPRRGPRGDVGAPGDLRPRAPLPTTRRRSDRTDCRPASTPAPGAAGPQGRAAADVDCLGLRTVVGARRAARATSERRSSGPACDGVHRQRGRGRPHSLAPEGPLEVRVDALWRLSDLAVARSPHAGPSRSAMSTRAPMDGIGSRLRSRSATSASISASGGTSVRHAMSRQQDAPPPLGDGAPGVRSWAISPCAW